MLLSSVLNYAGVSLCATSYYLPKITEKKRKKENWTCIQSTKLSLTLHAHTAPPIHTFTSALNPLGPDPVIVNTNKVIFGG